MKYQLQHKKNYNGLVIEKKLIRPLHIEIETSWVNKHKAHTSTLAHYSSHRHDTLILTTLSQPIELVYRNIQATRNSTYQSYHHMKHYSADWK